MGSTRSGLLALELILLIAVLGTPAVRAADFKIVDATAMDKSRLLPSPEYALPAYQYTIHLNGNIEFGDAEELRRIVNDIKDGQEYYFEPGIVLALNSEGGSYREAIELSTVVNTEKLATLVPRGGICTSGCAVVFMAAYEHAPESPPTRPRFVHFPATLGFHRPFINQRFDIPLSVLNNFTEEEFSTEISRSFEQAYDEANELIQQMLAVDPYAWNTELLLEMLTARQSDDTENYIYLEKIGQAIEWDITVIGLRDIDMPKLDDGSVEKWLCYNSRTENERSAAGWIFEDYHSGKVPGSIYNPGRELVRPAIDPLKPRFGIDAFEPHYIMMERLYGTGCSVSMSVDGTMAAVSIPDRTYMLDAWKDKLHAFNPYADIDSYLEYEEK